MDKFKDRGCNNNLKDVGKGKLIPVLQYIHCKTEFLIHPSSSLVWSVA